jgi:hypothetical protein
LIFWSKFFDKTKNRNLRTLPTKKCVEKSKSSSWALQWITMVNHGYPFGFWISMDKWLSISDVRKYVFLNQILSNKMHIAWKLIYFCIDSWIKTSEIGNDSRNIGSFILNGIELFWNFSIHPWIATMTSKEKPNENLYEWISGILGQILNGYPLQCSELKQIFTFKFSRFLSNSWVYFYNKSSL